MDTLGASISMTNRLTKVVTMVNENSESTAIRLPEFGLYYPYINFRDDQWLKAAALYWPKMARVVPADYPARDSEVARALNGELDFVLDLNPETALTEVANSFGRQLDIFTDSELARWQIKVDSASHLTDFGERSNIDQLINTASLDSTLAGVREGEMEHRLQFRLQQDGLAVQARLGWLAMHPELAWLYKCHLTEVLAERNRLIPTTDQLAAHAMVSNTKYGRRNITLGNQDSDISSRFGLLAVSAAVPRNLNSIPVEKIIKARRKFGVEFDRWRRHIDVVGAALAEQLSGVESPDVVDRYLREAVRSCAAQPVDDLQRGLSDLGIETRLGTITAKFALPSALATAGVAAASPTATAAGVAVGLAVLRHEARVKVKAKMATQAAYLLGIKETFADKNLLQQIMTAMRSAAGLRG